MKRALTILLLLMSLSTAYGQYLRLAGDTSRTSLYLDAGRIWNYNLYEHSRLGVGLRLNIHHKLTADAYVGYGIYDEVWKYGGRLTEHFNEIRQESFYQMFVLDYFAAGSRRLDSPLDEGGGLLGGFWSHRMTEQARATFGYRWRTSWAAWAVEAAWTKSGRLFDKYRLLYNNQGDAIVYYSYFVGRILMQHPAGVRLQVEASPSFEIARLLVQYSRSFPLKYLTLNVFAQGGISAPQSDYENMFDLGGTWGAPVYVGIGLATARPNEFTANNFTFVSLRLQTARPVFNIFSSLLNLGSDPIPFVALTAAWGNMWGQDADGRKTWQEMALQAPHYGLFEPMVGVDGVLQWGAVDWGLALTYRLVPAMASYRLANAHDNLTLLITATLHQ